MRPSSKRARREHERAQRLAADTAKLRDLLRHVRTPDELDAMLVDVEEDRRQQVRDRILEVAPHLRAH